MDTNQIGALGYAVAMFVYALLTILLLSGWQRSNQSRLPAMATAISCVWAGIWMAGFLDLTRAIALVTAVEWARGLAWLAASNSIFQEITLTSVVQKLRSRYGLFVFFLILVPVGYFLFAVGARSENTVWVVGGYVLSVLTVLTLEQLYRNSPRNSRSDIPYLCIAIAGVFLFDLTIYGLVIAGVTTEPEYWAARGFVNALFALPLAFGIWRRSRMTPAVEVPRQIAFYLFGVTLIAAYIAFVVVAYYLVQTYGGSWGAIGGIVLIVAAVVAAVVLLASARVRARVRVLMMKTFLQYKYDYRNEWLRFISTISASGLEDVDATAVRAVAQIVNSPGGVVWINEQESKSYLPAGAWRCAVPNVAPILEESGLVRFLRDRQWVVNLDELKQHPERYENLRLDDWLLTGDEWWLVVPLVLGKRLYGFIVLRKPRVVSSLNFEDHDLLRTAGSHVGMHINQAETDRRLTESRQFGAYNRLTAFLMHDLNNVIAQQSLVVKNAERFRDNPKFVDDAIETIAHSVSRMKRLMQQLNKGSKVSPERRTDVRDSLQEAVQRCKGSSPVPQLEIPDELLPITADAERLVTVFEHLIRNAQDATPADGEVTVSAKLAAAQIVVTIADTGEGMSPEFIRERLFRPFDSTKGSENMGIGVYQAREYVRTLGGQLAVSSQEQVGTTFTVSLNSVN